MRKVKTRKEFSASLTGIFHSRRLFLFRVSFAVHLATIFFVVFVSIVLHNSSGANQLQFSRAFDDDDMERKLLKDIMF